MEVLKPTGRMGAGLVRFQALSHGEQRGQYWQAIPV